MRSTVAAVSLLFVFLPSIAAGQTSGASSDPGRLSVHAAAGRPINYPGHTFSAGLAFSPVSRLDLAINAERLHLPTKETQSDGSFGVTRGGTMTFVSGEVRAFLFPPGRVSPFVLAGIGAGISRPNVNARFPEAVKNDLRVIYAGGGVRVPLRHGFSLVADARVMLGVELENDGIVGVVPVRVGVTWRF